MATKILLNMIVRDESAVIERCLNNQLCNVNSICISDTGSTDSTKALISSWCEEHSIPLRLVDHPWENFGKNRTHALEAAYEYLDEIKGKDVWYIMFTDADNISKSNDGTEPFKIDKENLDTSIDMYSAVNRRGCSYMYPHLVKYSKHFKNRWYWEMPLHEYIERRDIKWEPKKSTLEGGYIESRAEGARSTSKFKHVNDAVVLMDFIRTTDQKDPRMPRAFFYAAQSLRDSKLPAESEKMYIARVGLKGWIEEVYISLVNAARQRLIRGKNDIKVLGYLVAATTAIPDRIEAFSMIVDVYSKNKQYAFALNTGLSFLFPTVNGNYASERLDNYHPSLEKLQAHKKVVLAKYSLFNDEYLYDWAYFDIMSLCSYYAGDKVLSGRIIAQLLKHGAMNDIERARIENNLKSVLTGQITEPK